MLRDSTTLGTLSALLLASPLALAVEAHHPEETPPPGTEGAVVVVTPRPGANAPSEAGGPDTEGPAAAGGDDGGEAPAGDAPATAGDTGMASSPGGMGMMPQGMMGGMMGRGMGKGQGMGMGMGCPDMMQQKHGRLLGRLDVLEARTAKIEAMLERLLQR